MTNWLFNRLNFIASLILTCVVFALILFISNLEIKDMDLWLHLASGRFILDKGYVPLFDFLSFSASGSPWINHEWLFQLIVSSAYQLFGVDGLIAIKILVFTLLFAVLVSFGFKLDRKVLSLGLVICVIMVFQARPYLRPEIFSLLFLSFYLYLISFHLKNYKTIFYIALIQLLWTNIHGFFIMGPMLIWMTLGAEWIKKYIKLPFHWMEVSRLTDREYKNVKLLSIISFLVCFFNPHLIDGALYPFQILFSVQGDSSIYFNHIVELEKTLTLNTFFSLKEHGFFKVLIYVSFLSFCLNIRKLDIGLFTLWVVLLIFSLCAVRNIVFFSLVAYIASIYNFDMAVYQLRKSEELLKGKFASIASILIKCFLILYVVNYIGDISLRGYYDFDQYARKSEYGGISQHTYPQKAVDFLIDRDVSGNFFNDFNSGAYLLGRAHPKIRTFIDGRTELFGAEFFEEYISIINRGDFEAFNEVVDNSDVSGVFLSLTYGAKPKRILRYLYNSENWFLVYFNYDAIVFLKNSIENKRYAHLKMDLKNWNTPSIDLLRVGRTKLTPHHHIRRAETLYNLGLYDKALSEALEARRISDNNGRVALILGKVYLAIKEFDKALIDLNKARLAYPNDAEIRYYLSLYYFEVGDTSLAKVQANNSLILYNNNPTVYYLLSLIYAKEGDIEKSMRYYSKAIEIYPQNEDDILKIGKAYLDQKRGESAKELYRLALESYSSHERIKKAYKEL